MKNVGLPIKNADFHTINAGELPVGNCEPSNFKHVDDFSSSYMKIGYPLQLWID